MAPVAVQRLSRTLGGIFSDVPDTEKGGAWREDFQARPLQLCAGCAVAEAVVHQLVFRWLAILPVMIVIAVAGSIERALGSYLGIAVCLVAFGRFIKEVLFAPLPDRKSFAAGDASNDDVRALVEILKCGALFSIGAFQLATFSQNTHASRDHDEWIHVYGAGLLHYLHEVVAAFSHFVTGHHLSYALAPAGAPELRLSRLCGYGAMWLNFIYAWGAAENGTTFVRVLERRRRQEEPETTCELETSVVGSIQRFVGVVITWVQGWVLLHITLTRGIVAGIMLQLILSCWGFCVLQAVIANVRRYRKIAMY